MAFGTLSDDTSFAHAPTNVDFGSTTNCYEEEIQHEDGGLRCIYNWYPGTIPTPTPPPGGSGGSGTGHGCHVRGGKCT